MNLEHHSFFNIYNLPTRCEFGNDVVTDYTYNTTVCSPSISRGIDNLKDMGNLNIPKIPVNDNVLKYFGYGTTVLDWWKESSKPGSKYVPFVSIPINAASAYNSWADLVNKPSLEHSYKFAKSAVSFIPFYGGFISFTADNFERGALWFTNWLTEFEKYLQSNEFWLDLYPD